MIKIIDLRTNDGTMNVVQRNGKKRFVLALTINIETISEMIDKIDATTTVTFGIEEVPISAAKKLLADVGQDEAMIVIEHGKAVSDEVAVKLKAFVQRSVKALPIA